MESIAHKYFRNLTKDTSNIKEKLEIYKKEMFKISCFLFKEIYDYQEDKFDLSYKEGPVDVIIYFFSYEQYHIEYTSISFNDILSFMERIDEEWDNCICTLSSIFISSGTIFYDFEEIENSLKKYLQNGLMEISLKEKEVINKELLNTQESDKTKRRL